MRNNLSELARNKGTHLNYVLNVCPSPLPNSYVENVMPKQMSLGGGDFGRWLGHESKVLMNGKKKFPLTEILILS